MNSRPNPKHRLSALLMLLLSLTCVPSARAEDKMTKGTASRASSPAPDAPGDRSAAERFRALKARVFTYVEREPEDASTLGLSRYADRFKSLKKRFHF